MATVEELIGAARSDGQGMLNVASEAERHAWSEQQLREALIRHAKLSTALWVELLGDPIQKHLHRKGQL